MQKKFLFIHIPKTGGTTVRHMLKKQDTDRKLLLFGLGGSKAFQNFIHVTYDELFKASPDLDLSSYFSFAFVRNPWDRAYSEWLFRKQRKGQKYSFIDFLMLVKRKLEKNISAGQQHWRPQANFLSPQLSFIGRFENFENDLKEIFKRIGLKEPENIEKANATVKPDNWKEEFTKEAVEMINDIWQSDVETLGYEYKEFIEKE